MDKVLEAFENIRTQIRYPKGKRPERSKEELLNDLNIVEKELKEKEENDLIINSLKNTIRFEVKPPEIKKDDFGSFNVFTEVALKLNENVQINQLKLLRNWILQNCFPQELKALEILKKYLMFGFDGLLEDDTYLCFVESDDEYMSFRIKDKKEYDLLKEVLK